MSQEKVDRHKMEKANRQAIMRKEKRNRVLSVGLLLAVIIVAVLWLGYSIYQNAQPEVTNYVETNYDAFEEYISGLSA